MPQDNPREPQTHDPLSEAKRAQENPIEPKKNRENPREPKRSQFHSKPMTCCRRPRDPNRTEENQREPKRNQENPREPERTKENPKEHKRTGENIKEPKKIKEKPTNFDKDDKKDEVDVNLSRMEQHLRTLRANAREMKRVVKSSSLVIDEVLVKESHAIDNIKNTDQQISKRVSKKKKK